MAAALVGKSHNLLRLATQSTSNHHHDFSEDSNMFWLSIFKLGVRWDCRIYLIDMYKNMYTLWPKSQEVLNLIFYFVPKQYNYRFITPELSYGLWK